MCFHLGNFYQQSFHWVLCFHFKRLTVKRLSLLLRPKSQATQTGLSRGNLALEKFVPPFQSDGLNHILKSMLGPEDNFSTPCLFRTLRNHQLNDGILFDNVCLLHYTGSSMRMRPSFCLFVCLFATVYTVPLVNGRTLIFVEIKKVIKYIGVTSHLTDIILFQAHWYIMILEAHSCTESPITALQT